MKLSLVGETAELPYELGEMPQIYAALEPFGPLGFLESREGTEKYARFGIAAARPLLTVHGKGHRYTVNDDMGNEVVTDVADPLQFIHDLEPAVDLPHGLENFRFAAGWIGSLGYETAELFEDIPRAGIDDVNLPDTFFYLPSLVVLKDAASRRLTLVALSGDRAGARDLVLEAVRRLKEVDVAAPSDQGEEKREARTTFEEGEFLEAVAKCKELIHDGELIQVVISRRWEVDPAPPPELVYSALAVFNPSPYHFYLQMPGGVLLGASPELLVRREGDILTVRPIAGTRRRGGNEEEDLALEKEMMSDPKERAEHTMLVDLGRNDLGRVSEAGTVQVTRRMLVERYSHVMHLVSEVRSRIDGRYDSYDVLRACFPAGTVSGAPKIRAMQAIAGLEPVVRGPYAGGVGYFDVRGNMDFCITIRSVFYSAGRAYIQSGAGIVADSVPERERDEITAKAAAMVKAFGNVSFEK
ncbi:MAG: anthranilate synthase component I family protein [bacterium]|nr:anthranilate synthase component I family protein [bacterium]MDT8395075.1 anthranilate synthase component I family protein [bacterium]